MPVFNERELVEESVRRVLATPPPVETFELIVVDDGSTDGTGDLLRAGAWPDEVLVLEHDRNRGKGAAIRTGIARASGRWLTILDADLEYDVTDVGSLLAPLRDGTADAVFGVRGFTAHNAYSFWYVVGNKAVTVAANILYNCWLSDLMTCHKAMSTDLIRSLQLSQSGFTIEPEIAAKLLLRRKRIFEIPVTYRARTRAEGKKLQPVDGLLVLASLIRFRMRGSLT